MAKKIGTKVLGTLKDTINNVKEDVEKKASDVKETINKTTNAVAKNTVNTSNTVTTTQNKPVTTPVTNTGSGVASGTTTVSTPTYAQSQSVIDAKNYLNSIMSQKPGQFSSQYETQMNDLMDSILGREKFSYDLNTDMLYQQAKDQYTALGKLAMQDTMGQAAALTGGYGSSYASTAGNQAYQQHLQGLNENIPEYYQMALDKYNAEGDKLYNQYALASDMYNNDYAQYRDEMNDWFNEYSNAYNKYVNEQDLDYNNFVNSQNLAYQRERDAQELAYQRERDAIADAQWKSEYDLAMQDYANSSAKSSAKASAQTYSGLTDENFQLLERLASGGENKTIERWLNNWVVSGKISEETAQMLMDQYYTDSEEDGDVWVSAQQFYDNAPGLNYRTPVQEYSDKMALTKYKIQ